MKERRFKIHYAHGRVDIGLCGLDGMLTYSPNAMTCRICMFRYLAGQAEWAQSFLDELRDRTGRSQPPAILIPTATTEPVDAVIEGSGSALGRPFRQQRGSEKAIRELLPVSPAFLAPIKPVVHAGGASTEAVRVQGGDVAQNPGDTGEISNGTYGDFEPTKR